MNAIWMLDHPQAERKALEKSGLMALGLEILALVLAGFFQVQRMGVRAGAADESAFIEADVLQMPREAHLTSQVATPKSQAEAVLSKVAGKGKAAKPNEAKLAEQNQAQAGPQLGPTHGAVALFAPEPVIPEYLRDTELNASVVIEFLVPASGPALPRLIGSSGNEELDAVALQTVSKWQFRPAEKERLAVDSKVRLRIDFQVY